jgi:hypothetical protein
MVAIIENIEMLRDKLHRLLEFEADLSQGEILRLSQELDMLIHAFYSNRSIQ